MRSSIMSTRTKLYRGFCLLIIALLSLMFLFPLYWIVIGAFKTQAENYSMTPVWWPGEWTGANWESLFSRRSAPLFDLTIPFSRLFTEDGKDINLLSGPVVPGAVRWLLNTVWMSVMAMLFTCVTATLAGYALAKKRFFGRRLIFSLIVCAMALPKQVILIPLLREMNTLGLIDNLWAVILPTVGWPFGVFLMKQFCEGIPGEVLESARIDGAGEFKTFVTIVVPMVKPGIGALAIFTFINSWNDYFMQLIMLQSSVNYTLPLGIATMQGENYIDTGLLMAGAALAAFPIIIVFLIFQKYFTKGITMGAVKG